MRTFASRFSALLLAVLLLLLSACAPAPAGTGGEKTTAAGGNDPAPAPTPAPFTPWTVSSCVMSHADIPTLDDVAYDEDALTLPIFDLVTDDHRSITSTKYYKTAKISLSGAGEYNFTETPVSVRGRGNSTWHEFAKKPYKLKFDEKVDLFGMGAAKKWVLLANALDETMLRNALAFSLATALDLPYTTPYRFVNLFLNGRYLGVYMLCEQVEEGANRVDVKSSKTGLLDTGYLLEATEQKNSEEDDQFFTLPVAEGVTLGSEGWFQFNIKSPEAEECTDAQCAFIRDYVKRVNEAIFCEDWDAVCELCDVDTFVNMFLVNQVMLPTDMGYCFFLYKYAGGKLCMGPAWDFDQSSASSNFGSTAYTGWDAGVPHQWLMMLWDYYPEFRQLVTARYAEKVNDVRATVDLIDRLANGMAYDIAMNTYVWHPFGNPDRWRIPDDLVPLTDYRAHATYLKTWMHNRIAWLEKQFFGA